MTGELMIGAIFHHMNFEFKDGGMSNKYLIVIGAKPDCDYLCVLTTSKQWEMKSDRGCHHKPLTHFVISGDGKNFFRLDTWVQLYRPVIMSRSEMLRKGFEKIIQTEGNLNQNITGEIKNCLKNSKDISQQEKTLL